MIHTVKMNADVAITQRLRDAYVSRLPTSLSSPQGTIYGYVTALNILSEIDGCHEIEVKIEDPKRSKQLEDRCPCVPIPVLDQPDRRYAQLNVPARRIITSDEIIGIDGLPRMSRPGIEAGADQQGFQQYVMGPMVLDGEIVIRLPYGYHFEAGERVEVHLRHGSTQEYTRWCGYVERWCCKRNFPSHFHKSFTELAIRPTCKPEVVRGQQAKKESLMKVFETIVVSVDAQNTITGIVQPIRLITALDVQAAKDATLVDYAVENKLTGKDLTGFRVRTREFCG